jgi:hypothetical protein
MQKGRGLNRCASSTLYLYHTKGGLINHCLLMKWDCLSLVVILYYHHVDRKNVTKSITINKYMSTFNSIVFQYCNKNKQKCYSNILRRVGQIKPWEEPWSLVRHAHLYRKWPHNFDEARRVTSMSTIYNLVTHYTFQ